MMFNDDGSLKSELFYLSVGVFIFEINFQTQALWEPGQSTAENYSFSERKL